MIGPWKLVDNQMEIETRDSLSKAVILGTFHDNALATLSVTYPLLLLPLASVAMASLVLVKPVSNCN
jgi:hypothetical protein